MYKISKNLDQYSYKNIDLKNARVIVRSCLNVSVDNSGKVIDSTRYFESLPLLKELALNAQNVLITAHLGRPNGRSKDTSFWNVAELLRESLRENNVKVELVEDFSDKNIDLITHNRNDSNNKTIFLLENIRYFEGEESKDKNLRLDFAKKLATLGNTYINDAFADYRESASTYDIATLMPSFLGPAFLKEIEALSKFSNPNNLVSILGGAKLSEKLDALNALAEVSNKVIVGGAMAYTLLKALDVTVGNSLIENDKLNVAKEIVSKYQDKLVLPVDHLIANQFNQEASVVAKNTESANIPDNLIAIDIGSKTIKLFKSVISNADTILWNGPMGVFEWEKSSLGTLEIGKAIASNTKAYKLAGGGDSITAINKLNLTGFNHISTGGGAMLAFLAYTKFPTLDVILNQ